MIRNLVTILLAVGGILLTWKISRSVIPKFAGKFEIPGYLMTILQIFAFSMFGVLVYTIIDASLIAGRSTFDTIAEIPEIKEIVALSGFILSGLTIGSNFYVLKYIFGHLTTPKNFGAAIFNMVAIIIAPTLIPSLWGWLGNMIILHVAGARGILQNPVIVEFLEGF